jgi:N-acetylmuramoyl-L-alanine amidase
MLNKKKLLISFTLFVIYLILVVFAFLNIDNYAKINAPNNNVPTIIIDPGHGGDDGGAFADNTIEKDLNLSISKKLYKLLISSGFNVKMTRRCDEMINTEGKTLRERKVSDMKKRLSIYNSNINNIVISIHQNKFPIEKYNGTQVFYSKNNKNSKNLADSIKNSVKALMQPYNEREVKPADKDIYLLYNSKAPSVIVECGFISNTEEVIKLKSEKYQSELTFAIFSGLLVYYNENEVGYGEN